MKSPVVAGLGLVVAGSPVSKPYQPSAQNASAPLKHFSHVMVLALLQGAAVFKARWGNLVFSPACKEELSFVQTAEGSIWMHLAVWPFLPLSSCKCLRQASLWCLISCPSGTHCDETLQPHSPKLRWTPLWVLASSQLLTTMHHEKRLHAEHWTLFKCLAFGRSTSNGFVGWTPSFFKMCQGIWNVGPLCVPQLSFMGSGFKRPHLLADHFLVLQVAPWCWAYHGHQANLAQPRYLCFQRAAQNADISHRLACEAWQLVPEKLVFMPSSSSPSSASSEWFGLLVKQVIQKRLSCIWLRHLNWVTSMRFGVKPGARAAHERSSNQQGN